MASESEERRKFIARVKQARMSRYKTQTPLLTILDLSQGTYKQYERRTPLPHRLIPKFCAATDVSIEWLLTGDGRGPVEMVSLPVAKLKDRQVRKTRRA